MRQRFRGLVIKSRITAKIGSDIAGSFEKVSRRRRNRLILRAISAPRHGFDMFQWCPQPGCLRCQTPIPRPSGPIRRCIRHSYHTRLRWPSEIQGMGSWRNPKKIEVNMGRTLISFISNPGPSVQTGLASQTGRGFFKYISAVLLLGLCLGCAATPSGSPATSLSGPRTPCLSKTKNTIY